MLNQPMLLTNQNTIKYGSISKTSISNCIVRLNLLTLVKVITNILKNSTKIFTKRTNSNHQDRYIILYLKSILNCRRKWKLVRKRSRILENHFRNISWRTSSRKKKMRNLLKPRVLKLKVYSLIIVRGRIMQLWVDTFCQLRTILN